MEVRCYCCKETGEIGEGDFSCVAYMDSSCFSLGQADLSSKTQRSSWSPSPQGAGLYMLAGSSNS